MNCPQRVSEPIEYFLIITVQQGDLLQTRTAIAKPTPNGTRADLFRWMVDNLPKELRGAVVFYSAEPNRLHEIDGKTVWRTSSHSRGGACVQAVRIIPGDCFGHCTTCGGDGMIGAVPCGVCGGSGNCGSH